MNSKNSRRLKDFLLFIGWGILAMIAVSALAILYALLGWGV